MRSPETYKWYDSWDDLMDWLMLVALPVFIFLVMLFSVGAFLWGVLDVLDIL